ncbi:hypothetical protein M231_01365 [Tremella mesenterica]|uniref:Uncharacterized protein n=1 Tax=Tremella mesenterica TaxID=5217 RepID=A0A4Q1BT31_TREME|nr:hypothetical protein M231_01365 [Tremella mesenterica]
MSPPTYPPSTPAEAISRVFGTTAAWSHDSTYRVHLVEFASEAQSSSGTRQFRLSVAFLAVLRPSGRGKTNKEASPASMVRDMLKSDNQKSRRAWTNRPEEFKLLNTMNDVDLEALQEDLDSALTNYNAKCHAEYFRVYKHGEYGVVHTCPGKVVEAQSNQNPQTCGSSSLSVSTGRQGLPVQGSRQEHLQPADWHHQPTDLLNNSGASADSGASVMAHGQGSSLAQSVITNQGPQSDHLNFEIGPSSNFDIGPSSNTYMQDNNYFQIGKSYADETNTAATQAQQNVPSVGGSSPLSGGPHIPSFTSNVSPPHTVETNHMGAPGESYIFLGADGMLSLISVNTQGSNFMSGGTGLPLMPITGHGYSDVFAHESEWSGNGMSWGEESEGRGNGNGPW